MSVRNVRYQSTWPVLSIMNIGVSGGVFGALAYFTGRRYLEGYYLGLNIPSNIFSYDFVECIYSSIYSLSIIFPIVVTVIVYRCLKLLMLWELGRSWSLIEAVSLRRYQKYKPIPSFKYKNCLARNIFWLPTITYVFIIAVLVFSFIIPEINMRRMIQMPFLLISLFYAFLLTEENRIISLFERYRKTKKAIFKQVFAYIFIFSLIFTVWLSIPMPCTWGQAKGISDLKDSLDPALNPFPVSYLQVVNSDDYPSISWSSVNNSVYTNDKPLIILASDSKVLFVKTQDTKREVLMISRNDIVAIEIEE